MDSIENRILAIRSTLPPGVELVAVSKFHPIHQIQIAYDAGQRAFAESRILEFCEKAQNLPTDIRWHFIGHIQTNKLRRLLQSRSVYLIESVDSIRLLELIDTESASLGITTRVLLQVLVAAEESKFGFTPAQIIDYIASGAYKKLKATQICGIMGMATNTDDTTRIQKDFTQIADIYRRCRQLAPDLKNFNILSMGMSDDYQLAIAKGSTHIRIGTAIFGPRTQDR